MGGRIGPRPLVIVADDYGIGPATSAGILKLCRAGVVTGTVLLVNSIFADEAVAHWQKSPPPADLGWHPCLTLDAPVLPADQVPSLVGGDGRFLRLGGLMARIATRRVNRAEIRAEFAAQLRRFIEMTGRCPAVVNSHHHVQVFPIVGAALRDVLRDCRPAPYLRRVREPWPTLRQVGGARAKRLFLSTLGTREAARQMHDGYPGNNWLLGITDPPCVHRQGFFESWLAAAVGGTIELTCHPGERDETVLGRDATPGDGNLERREQEFNQLKRPGFRADVERMGFRFVRPSQVSQDGVADEFGAVG